VFNVQTESGEPRIFIILVVSESSVDSEGEDEEEVDLEDKALKAAISSFISMTRQMNALMSMISVGKLVLQKFNEKSCSHSEIW
jgi:hypothetical protein